MSVPPKMQAVRTVDVHQSKVELVDTPKPGAGEVLIKNKVVTLNPTDWKHVAFVSPPGTTVGCDFAGEIVAVGSGVDNGLKAGDLVSGFVHGGKYDDKGSFAEYLKAKAKAVMKVPEGLDLGVAASVGIAGTTAVQAVFQRLGVAPPSGSIAKLPEVTASSQKLLVWSGSTAVGQYAIQLARTAGCYVITTASPRNHDLVKSLGAAEVYDYADKSTPETISSKHPDLSIALDCISENGSQQASVHSLGKKQGGKVCVLLPRDKEAFELRKDVEIIHTLIYSSLGDEMAFGKRVFDKDEVTTDFKYMNGWLDGSNGLLYHLFKTGLLKGNRITYKEGGLHGIEEGMQYQREGKVSAEKLAYTISA